MIGKDEIENRVGFHKATIEGADATQPRHTEVRVMFKEFMNRLDEILPDGRLKDLAMDDLERGSMWCHKSIAEKAPLIRE